MTAKKVSFGARPSTRALPEEAESWIDHRGPGDGPEPMKRLTIDIPASLHRDIKSQCASRGAKIADEIRELLLKKYRNSQM